MKTHARAVVVGGGAVGASIAYHLAKAGWETVLLERDELTSGSTWHAAGLLPLFNMGYATTHIHDYSVKFYHDIEAETGLNSGFSVVGNLRMAQTQARIDEYMLYASVAETAGIPFAAWIADRLGLPMVYVRKKPKGFGRDAQIEGDLKDGARVLLVEDLTTDGGSKITFCEALKSAGASVTDTIAVFYYDIFPDTPERLAAHGLTLHYLATWWDVLDVCKKQDYFDKATLKEVESFLNNPLAWSGEHGGATEISK